jgi:hypothetical protein
MKASVGCRLRHTFQIHYKIYLGSTGVIDKSWQGVIDKGRIPIFTVRLSTTDDVDKRIKHNGFIRRGWFDKCQDKFAIGFSINEKQVGKVLIRLYNVILSTQED